MTADETTAYVGYRKRAALYQAVRLASSPRTASARGTCASAAPDSTPSSPARRRACPVKALSSPGDARLPTIKEERERLEVRDTREGALARGHLRHAAGRDDPGIRRKRILTASSRDPLSLRPTVAEASATRRGLLRARLAHRDAERDEEPE
jgi:hypothetical protein